VAISSIGVVGCGLMGRGIAQVSAQSGFQTVVSETEQARLDQGLGAIRAFLQSGVEKGKVTAADLEATLGRIRGTTSLADLAACDLVIESATENLAVKKEIFRALDAAAKPGAILASNTSSLSITEMAAVTKRPERFVGLHFFNPVPLMPLVEIVRTLQTADEVYGDVAAWCAKTGKTAVTVRDSTGFIVNRLLVPYMLDAIRVFEQGLASRDDIDHAMKLGCGHPMGPLFLTDYVGLDTTYAIAEIMFDEFRETRFAPPPLLKRMVLAGRHGRKTGRGFYDWSTQPPS